MLNYCYKISGVQMKKISYIVVLILFSCLLFTACNEKGESSITGVPKAKFVVEVFDLNLNAVAGIELVSTEKKKSLSLGKTDENGKLEIKLYDRTFFEEFATTNMVYKITTPTLHLVNTNFKSIAFAFRSGDSETPDIIRYYVDDINTTNELKAENFLEFGGPVVSSPNTPIAGVKFSIGGKVKCVSYADKLRPSETGYLIRHVFKGTIITVEYENDTHELDYLLDDKFNPFPLGKQIKLEQSTFDMGGLRIRLVLKEKSKA